MFSIRAAGDWPPGQVVATWTTSTRAIVPEVERAIADAWDASARRHGDKLFDGPMCRLEKWSASGQRLELTLSRTSYRPFLGTNLFNAHLADTYGEQILANPVGVSTLLETADNWLLLGRRNDSVAYYPNRVHPFAGALEPREPMDVFEEVRRELSEELSLATTDLSHRRCIGLIEDQTLRQPELVFMASTHRTRAEVQEQLDQGEHCAVYAVQKDRAAINRAMTDRILTPVAAGSLALWLERA